MKVSLNIRLFLLAFTVVYAIHTCHTTHLHPKWSAEEAANISNAAVHISNSVVFLLTNDVAASVNTSYPQTNGISLLPDYGPPPTNHFEWMPKLFPDDFQEPEWNRIRFGNNLVQWIMFRRGIYGNNWNGWEPTAATNSNAVIFQSVFEPVVSKEKGVWLITFKRPTQ